jgi:hypothetical protein
VKEPKEAQVLFASVSEIRRDVDSLDNHAVALRRSLEYADGTSEDEMSRIKEQLRVLLSSSLGISMRLEALGIAHGELMAVLDNLPARAPSAPPKQGSERLQELQQDFDKRHPRR